MTVRVSINGFGRIGRNVLRAIYESGRTDIKVVAINDLGDVEMNAYLLKKDSVHGRFPGDISVDGDAIVVNGDRIRVTGSQTDDGFSVQRGANPVELPECVMTFAYWNPDFLEQPRLLNPQTGEYVDITVEQAGNDVVEVRGQQVSATRFRLTAYNVDLTLWYSPDDEWLALESVAKGGHIIRYELS